jgi:hypothetical protein
MQRWTGRSLTSTCSMPEYPGTEVQTRGRNGELSVAPGKVNYLLSTIQYLSGSNVQRSKSKRLFYRVLHLQKRGWTRLSLLLFASILCLKSHRLQVHIWVKGKKKVGVGTGHIDYRYRFELKEKKGGSWDRALLWTDNWSLHRKIKIKTCWKQPHTCYRWPVKPVLLNDICQISM